MSLLVAILARDGVVLGADGPPRSGASRSNAAKICSLNDRAVWGAWGELALIQRVAEQIDSSPYRTQPLATTRDALAGFVKDAMQSIIGMDARTPFLTQSPDALLGFHAANFVFVEYREGARILHVPVRGPAEWLEGRFLAAGDGGVFAHALMQKYAHVPFTCEHAKLLAYKVIDEAIAVRTFGLEPPIDIWEVSVIGVKRAGNEELLALEDTARLVREREVAMLTNGVLGQFSTRVKG